MNQSADTIAAIATPSGPGGIAIIRMSGSQVLSIVTPLFVSPTGRTAATLLPRTMHYGFILDADGVRLDEALVVHMPGPHSATGEDVLEIHCHGGPAIAAAILEAVLTKGARLAEPGEFTRRAFLSGRIDLAQAEAVAEAIAAPTREGVRLAQAKMSGSLSQMVNELRGVIDTLRMHFAAALDFPDEEGEIVPQAMLMEQVEFVKERLGQAMAGYERARLWREGASIVLIGQVNAGKSSLLNALLGRERAIVSDTPGTTRDYIEETIQIGGMPLRCVDTAGLRMSADHIEEEGMRRALELAAEADVVVLVTGLEALNTRNTLEAVDTFKSHDTPDMTDTPNTPNTPDMTDSMDNPISPNIFDSPETLDTTDIAVPANFPDFPGFPDAPDISHAPHDPDALSTPHSWYGFKENSPEHAFLSQRQMQVEADNVVIVVNKADKDEEESARAVKRLAQIYGLPVCAVSAKYAKGLDGLSRMLESAVLGKQKNLDTDIAPNLRQASLLKQALEEMLLLEEEVLIGLPLDIVSLRLDAVAHSLEEVIGVSNTDDLLGAIFSSFCIGK